MSDIFSYDTTAGLKIEENPLKAQYPDQTDNEYWSKVPQLFEQEFEDKTKLETFKSNWIVNRVPLYLSTFGQLEESYIKDTLSLIFRHVPPSSHEDFLSLMVEPRRGHTDKSYAETTVSFDIDTNGSKRVLKNIGYLRSIRVHNVLMFECTTSKKIKDYDVIVEIGGGIGEFAKIVRDTGFEGEYYGVDFPPMCEINQYYNEFNEKNFYVNDAIDLPDFGDKKVLVIGTWSFSEVPVLYREEIISKIPGCDWLLTIQANVMGIDNLNYFCNDFGPRTGKRNQIYHIQFHPYQGGNFYYFVT